jgi:Ca-activated chloride channel family protein
MLAIDVSYSMNATDVTPSRLKAAQAAADRFLDIVPAGTRIGLVAFSGSAQVVTQPTSDHSLVRSAIDQLQLGPGTAIGEALYASLSQLHKVAPGSAAAASPSRPPDSPARVILVTREEVRHRRAGASSCSRTDDPRSVGPTRRLPPSRAAPTA